MNATSESQGIIRVVIMLAGLIAIRAGVMPASSIIGPLLLAVVISILPAGVRRRLERRGVPAGWQPPSRLFQ